jgi:hypothetical protein
MAEYTLEIVGTSPLLMHSARLSNPLDPNARAMKKISAKRNKSEEDYLALAKLEFIGGLYHDAEMGPYIPGANVFRTLVDAARKRKLGTRVTSSLFVRDDVNLLAYKGPRDIESLWADENFRHEASVKVGTSRVIRTRPQFRSWGAEATLVVDSEGLDQDDLAQIVNIAGRMVGLGDWRPIFGRFTGTLTKIEEGGE